MASVEHEKVHFIREVAGALRRAARAHRHRDPAAGRGGRVRAAVVRDDAREHFVALHLDGRHRPIAHQVVSIGTASASLVHPREVFQPGSSSAHAR